MKKSKYEKKEITKFLQKELKKELTPELEKIGFIPPTDEKPFPNTGFFDLWSKKYGKRTPFAIWEIEVEQQYADNNIWKLENILKWSWKPKLFVFQIFSPHIKKATKKYCNDAVKQLKRKYKNRLTYKPIDIKISKDKFTKILERFEKSKYYARSYYGDELKKEMKRIIKEIINVLQEIN